MGTYDNIDIDFAYRTRRIIEQYDEKIPKGRENYDVTLLINCLVGLLIVPQQRRYRQIPDVPLKNLAGWDIDPSFVESWGHRSNAKPTLREFVRHLRNGVAHFHIKAEGTKDDIQQLKFSDENGFCATIPVGNLRHFAMKLASTICT